MLPQIFTIILQSLSHAGDKLVQELSGPEIDDVPMIVLHEKIKSL